MTIKSSNQPSPKFTSIWFQPERPSRGSQPGLTRQQIVRAAIAIADAEGFEAVTMRRIATELGVGTMSLYWHVPNKDNLLELMRDELMGDVEMPDPSSTDWRANLRQIAHSSRANMLRHSWMLSIFASIPSMGPNLLRHVDLSLAAVDDLGLDLATMFSVISVVDDYTMGFVLGEINQERASGEIGASAEELRRQWQEMIEPFARQAIETGNYPRLARVDSSDTVDFFDTDRHFSEGLETVLDGIAVRIEAEQRGSRTT